MGRKEHSYVDIMSVHPGVTGSCNVVTVRTPYGEKFHFIVDCGLFQEEGCNDWNKKLVFDPNNIDFCLVTHAHVDHIGRLPLLTKNGYKGDIYVTEDTKKIMIPALEDSARVLRSNSKSRHGRRAERPLYTDSDISDVERLIRACNFNQWIPVRDNVNVMFLQNGHLFGSAMILVRIRYFGQRDINILFTGDFNYRNHFFYPSPMPDWIYDIPLTIVQESTYGYMESSEIKKTFADNVTNCVNRGGTVIIPTFALGRMQEILYELKILQITGKIPSGVKIYIDGKLGIKYTMMCKNGVFDVKDEMTEFIPENVIFVDKPTRGMLFRDTSCKIIVTTSGMGSHGPAQTYIPAYISRKNALIQFTGYVAEGTLGRELKDAPNGDTVNIRGVLHRKEADVEYTNEFSSHAKADEMISFLQLFERLNLVLVNHGEPESKRIFATRILNETNAKNVAILGQYFHRINPYGLVMSKSAKLL